MFLFQKMATAAPDDTYQAQDSLSCGVCFERYNGASRLPKILPCQHTFCVACVDSLAIDSDDGFECPVCRNKTSTEDVRTNLAVRDIVEELDVQQSTSLLSRASRVLAHVYRLLPAIVYCVCERTADRHTPKSWNWWYWRCQGLHEEVSVQVIEEKIAALGKASASEVDHLMQESENHAKDVEGIVSKITEMLEAWKQDQLQNCQRKAQQAINKQSEMLSSLKVSLNEKLNASDIQGIAKLHKEIGNNCTPSIEMMDTKNIRLQQENLDHLQDKLCSMRDTIRASMKDGTLPLTSLNITDISVREKQPKELGGDISKSVAFHEPLCSPDVQDLNTPINGSKALQTDQCEPPEGPFGSGAACNPAQAAQEACASSEAVRDPSSCPTCIAARGNSICPKCNANIPLYVERKANLYNLRRNNKFHRVVHDRRRGKNTLICELDDFLFYFEITEDKDDIVDGRWSVESQRDLRLFEVWDDVLHQRECTNHKKNVISTWKRTLSAIRSGAIAIDWDE